MAFVTLSSVNAVIGGLDVVAAAQTVNLTDNSGGPNNGLTGDGRYIVSLLSGGSYRVTQNSDVSPSDTLINILEAHVVNGATIITDKRNLQVSHDAIASILNRKPDANGNYSKPTVIPASSIIGGVGSATLAGDTDVAITTPVDSQLLAYSATSAKWSNKTPVLAIISDIDFTTAGVGKVLAQVASGGKAYSFITPASGSSSTLGSDTDIDFTTSATNKVLAVVASNGKPYSFITPASSGSSSSGPSTPAVSAGTAVAFSATADATGNYPSTTLLSVASGKIIRVRSVIPNLGAGGSVSIGISGGYRMTLTCQADHNIVVYIYNNTTQVAFMIASGNSFFNYAAPAVLQLEIGVYGSSGIVTTGFVNDLPIIPVYGANSNSGASTEFLQQDFTLSSLTFWASAPGNVTQVYVSDAAAFQPTLALNPTVATALPVASITYRGQLYFIETPAPIGTDYDTAILAIPNLTDFFPFNDASTATVAHNATAGTATGAKTGNVTFGSTALLTDTKTSVAIGSASDFISFPAFFSSANNLPQSFEFWTKLNTGPGSTGVMMGNGDANNVVIYREANGHLKLLIGGSQLESTFTLQGSTLYHIVFTYDGTTYIVYVNGVNIFSGTSAIGAASGTAYINRYSGNLNIGATYEKFAVYKAALSAAQVSTNYTNGTTSGSGSAPADDLYVCRRLADNSYAWKLL